MKFKGKKVFVEVDEAGAIVVEKGRARMKYRLEDDRIYNPNPQNLLHPDAAEPELPFQTTKPVGGAKKAPAKGKGATAKEAGSASSLNGAVVAYTDGACSGNPGPAGLGYAIAFPDGRHVQGGEPLGQGTNNIAELTAILRVLEIVGDPSQRVVIHTDSEYSIGVLARGWKAKANMELIYRIRGVLAKYSRVEFKKVKGHAGVPDNELVDRLARAAAEKQVRVEE